MSVRFYKQLLIAVPFVDEVRNSMMDGPQCLFGL